MKGKVIAWQNKVQYQKCLSLESDDIFHSYLSVVYFDQQMSAPHAARWSKSFVFALKQDFSYFSVTNGKKKQKKRKAVQKHGKTSNKRGSTSV